MELVLTSLMITARLATTVLERTSSLPKEASLTTSSASKPLKIPSDFLVMLVISMTSARDRPSVVLISSVLPHRQMLEIHALPLSTVLPDSTALLHSVLQLRSLENHALLLPEMLSADSVLDASTTQPRVLPLVFLICLFLQEKQ